MKKVLVVGGASFDTLHFFGQTHHTFGGGGLYTALAARRCGVDAGLFAPLPHPMPASLQPAADRLFWLGPQVTPDEIPRMEIEHNEKGTTYLSVYSGAELTMDPGQLPADLSDYSAVHVIGLGSLHHQLAFLQACRQRNAPFLSAGANLGGIQTDPQTTQAVLEIADVYFLNETEGIALFGSVEAAQARPGKLMFLTLGAKGVQVIQGSVVTHIPALSVPTVDPTGAGDTFCGSTLAFLAQGYHPVEAARRAVPPAAETVQVVGPAALLADTAVPPLLLSPRVSLDAAQIERVATLAATLPEVADSDFAGPDHPPVGDPGTLDFFFASTLQQFGFWTTQDGRYHQPLIAPIQGQMRKGSSYLSQVYRRAMTEYPEFLTVKGQASVTAEAFAEIYRDDNGQDVMPALDLHWQMARSYGQDMQALGYTPQSLVEEARGSERPLQTLLMLLDKIGGYKEDPLRKKSMLLALILNQRPEKFLTFAPDDIATPVIDYHLMRSCLRVGLIEVKDEALAAAIAARRVISEADEQVVRQAAYNAIEQLTAVSGKTIGAIDWFFFDARRRCPEMTEPECAKCALDPICAKRKELFQPVYRTTAY
ncbi:MAG: hypothetical protein H6654_18125 [Ardenticatenaceae bacterium]|nr:hypothetical protein [Ardenticatenaceae bacterium]MCB8975482.1 hypothetical protein [Ardenticatenaceae bacterium]